MKRKFDSAAMFQIRSDAEAIENMEKRGKDLKEGRTVTVTSSNVLLPSHTNAEIGAYPFRDVSTLVDKVRIVNLEGGETYKKSFVKSTGMAGLTAEGDPYTTAEPTFGYATITKVKVTAYAEITEELEKLPALPYSQEVLRGINIALRKRFHNKFYGVQAPRIPSKVSLLIMLKHLPITPISKLAQSMTRHLMKSFMPMVAMKKLRVEQR